MTLFKGIAANYNKKFAICIGNSTNTGSNFDNYPFNIPDEANYISFYLVGPGGGGFSGTAAAGGGGGGSGGVTSAIFSAKMLPSVIYLCPGQYGLGAIAGSGQTSGSLTYLTVHPFSGSSDPYIDLLTANTGSASNSSAGGNAGTALTISNIKLAGFALCSPLLGGGNAGGSQNTATTYPPNSVSLVTGGAGGAGSSNTAGASVTAVSNLSNPLWVPSSSIIVSGGAGTTITNAGNGANGLTNLYELNGYKANNYPLFATGGAGGGGATSGNGGNGGNGAPGCGGGGGGISTLGTPGNGGNGGPGFIIIQWW